LLDFFIPEDGPWPDELFDGVKRLLGDPEILEVPIVHGGASKSRRAGSMPGALRHDPVWKEFFGAASTVVVSA
jgi:hypothetical protein